MGVGGGGGEGGPSVFQLSGLVFRGSCYFSFPEFHDSSSVEEDSYHNGEGNNRQNHQHNASCHKFCVVVTRRIYCHQNSCKKKKKKKKTEKNICLTFKAPITTSADDIFKYFSLFLEKIRLEVSSESSARQRIHMKNQSLIFFEDKRKKTKMSAAAIFVWRFKD